jgi:hypothetical protein
LCFPFESFCGRGRSNNQKQKQKTNPKLEQKMERFTEAQRQNFLMLEHFLSQHNMQVRLSSEYCLNFILTGEGDFDQILRKMEQARFLHEYCDFAKGFEKASKLRGGKLLPKQHWKNLINECVLYENGHTTFPAVWPWNIQQTSGEGEEDGSFQALDNRR